VFIKSEEIVQNIKLPQASVIAVLGVENASYELSKKYKVSDKINEDTRFAIIGEDNEAGVNAYKLSKRSIPFCLVGARPECLLLNDVLWNGVEPFVATMNEPEFMVVSNKSRKADLEFCVRLIFAVAEKITMDVIEKGYSDTVFPVGLRKVEYVDDNLGELIEKVRGRVDGLKQAESALTLLKAKEKNKFERSDMVVLLAKYLSKVYNYFIRYQPQNIFPPDNNGREEALMEFFAVKTPKLRGMPSEFAVRKRYYMIEQNVKMLRSLWEEVCVIIDDLFCQHRMFTENNGFCIEQISEDAKFACFIAPDLLDGETLLSFIKDSGVADNFI
jgi:hypothetical protein